jgi:hypothetical protein
VKIRLLIQRPTRADWSAPATLAGEVGAIAAGLALIGLPLLEWRTLAAVACFAGGLHQARLAMADYRRRRQALVGHGTNGASDAAQR